MIGKRKNNMDQRPMTENSDVVKYNVNLHLLLVVNLLLFGLLVFITSNGLIYYGDDGLQVFKSNNLSVETLGVFSIRISEVLVGYASALYWDEFWFFCLVSLTLLNAAVSVRIIMLYQDATHQSNFSRYLFSVALIASPLYAQLISQIDTVSQGVGNTASLLCLYYILKYSQFDQSSEIHKASLFACLALFSKETFILMPLLPVIAAFLGFYKKRRDFNTVLGTAVIAFSALVIWLLLKNYYGGMGSSMVSDQPGNRYGLNLDLVSITKNFIFAISSPLNVVPSSLIGLSGRWELFYVVVGLIVSLTFLWLLKFLTRQTRHCYFAIFTVLIVTPLTFTHAAELYATALTPIIQCALLLIALQRCVPLILISCFSILLFFGSLFNGLLLSDIKCDYLRDLKPNVSARECMIPDLFLGEAWKDAEYSIYYSPIRNYFGTTIRDIDYVPE